MFSAQLALIYWIHGNIAGLQPPKIRGRKSAEEFLKKSAIDNVLVILVSSTARIQTSIDWVAVFYRPYVKSTQKR